MKDITKLLKEGLKPTLDVAETKIEQDGQKLEDKTKKLLDINGDGKLTKNDIIGLLLDFVDTDNDGQVSIWEVIAVLFQLRKILKSFKK